MKKEFRIKKRSEIDEVFNNKKSKGNDRFVIYHKDSNEKHFRFAISIGKKFGNAVNRNLCKRRIREVIRKHEKVIKETLFVIVVKKEAAQCSYFEIEQKIYELLLKTKIIDGERK